MLIQNYLLGCIEASFATSSSEITKKDSCDWASGAELLEMSPENDKCPLDGCRKSNLKDGDPCSLNSLDGPRPSTFSAMSGSSKPVVYQRKKFRRNPLPTFSIEPSAEVRPSNGCPSELCSEVHSGTLKEDIVAAEKLATAAPFLLPAECSNFLSEGESGPIALMLKETGIYRTCVRIGKNFQAEVPDWTGPVIDEVDRNSEPLEIRPSESLCPQERSCNNHSRISSIGNWLQCRQVIEGFGECVDGSICGKWRRGPLFEVQTDDWECFRAVLWDPAHADCAVPQELETEEVLKQLKYIEMLKPRLAVKKRRLDQASGAGARFLTEN